MERIEFAQFGPPADTVYAYILIGLDVLGYVKEPVDRLYSGVQSNSIWTLMDEDDLYEATRKWLCENVQPEDRADCVLQVDPGRDQVHEHDWDVLCDFIPAEQQQ